MVKCKQTILLVEDDEQFGLTVIQWLKNHGFNCVLVTTGEKALETVQMNKTNIDLILMDIDLGDGIDGTEAAKKILRDYEIPLLFLTSNADEETIEKTEKITSYGFVIKDIMESMLIGSMKMAIKLHNANKELKVQKKALLLNEEKLNGISVNLPGMVFQFYARNNNEYGLYYVSDRCAELLGLDNKDIENLFQRFLNGIVLEDRDRFIDSIKLAAQTFSNWNFDGTYFKPTGEEFFFRGISKPRLVNDELIFDGILIDITEQRRTEKANRISKEKYSELLNNMNEGFFISDERGIITFANKALAKIHGFNSPYEMINHSFFEFIETSSLNEVRENHTSHLQTGKIKEKNIFGISKPNGSRAFVKVNPSLIYDGEQVVGRTGLVEDVTEQMCSEEILRASEERFRLVAESTESWIWEVDGTGLYTYCSPVIEKILGYKPEELVGKKHFYDLFIPDIKKSLKETAFAIFEQKGSFNKIENPNLHKDGRIVMLETSGFPIFDDNGNLQGYRGIDNNITERKLAHKKLIAAEIRYRTLFEQSPDGIVIIDPGTTSILEFNTQAHTQLGYTRQEFSKLKISDIEVDENPNEIQNHIEKILHLKKGDFVTRQKTRLGEIKNIFVQVRIIEGLVEPIYLCIWRDITERMQILEQLKIKDFALRSSLSAVGIADLRGNIIFANDSYLKLWGYKSEKDVIGTNIFQYNTENEEAKNFYQMVSSALKTHSGFSGDGVACKLDGTPFFIQVSANEVLSDTGEPISIMASFADITNRKKSEKNLTLLSHSVKSVTQGVTITNLENKILFVNQAFLDIYGYSEGEVIGKHISFVKADEEIDYPEIIKETLRGKWEGELLNRRKNGSDFPISLSTSPIGDENGINIGLIGVMSDITERKQTEASLESYRSHLEDLIKERTAELEQVNLLLQNQISIALESEKIVKNALIKEQELNDLKSRFVSTASHEFKTPLTTILIAADLLDMYGREWPESKYFEYVNIIQNSANYMTELINDVLTFSKSDAGLIKFNPCLVDVYKLSNDLINELSLSAPANIKIMFDFIPQIKVFFLDDRLVKQILSNLLSNAIKYSPNGGTIKLIVDLEDNNLKIVVSDEGIGIPKEDQTKLFEPFNRAKNIGTIPGTGLGLSIVKKYVDMHNGQVVLKSEENVGTSVTLMLKTEEDNKLKNSK